MLTDEEIPTYLCLRRERRDKREGQRATVYIVEERNASPTQNNRKIYWSVEGTYLPCSHLN